MHKHVTNKKFICWQCSTDFYNLGYSGDGMTCNNTNECTTELGGNQPTHNCASDANCTDTMGSFSCECREGYTGDGVTCRGYYLL